MIYRAARLFLLVCLGVFSISTTLHAKPSKPGVPEEGKFNPMPAVSDTTLIPQDALAGMYRSELGERFHDADIPKLYAAHQLLESYFDATSFAQRKSLVKALEDTGVDADTLGRLTRMRMRWPSLEGGVYYVNEKRGPFTVRYFLGIPAGYDRTRAYPLVVKLAEADPFAADPPPDAEAVATIYNDWVKQELSRHPDAVLLMPLLDLDDQYGPSYVGMNGVIQAMLHAADRVNLDPARVYLIGHSLGGHAAWNIALHYPTYFAAIAPLAGAAGQDWQRLRLMNLRNTLPVVWADAKDEVVKVNSSRGIVTALKTLKIEVNYEETKDHGHVVPAEIEEERYKTMRLRTRSVYPQWVSLQSNRPDVIFDRNDWVQIWQESDPGKETKAVFRRLPEKLTFYTNSAKVNAVRDGNAIDLTLSNVESLRLYLNDQMVDLSKPITITINKKKKIQGAVKRNISTMLNDQLFIGRGWRYFTAVLDIDLSDPNAAMNPTTKPSTRPATKPALVIPAPK